MQHNYFKLPVIVFFLLGFSILHAEPIRIMPLGDSLTYDNNRDDNLNDTSTSKRTGYRSHLWYGLQNASYDADFVGSEVAGEAITPPFDPDNEGHPGWDSYEISERIYGWLEDNPADIVLLHIGTNDHRTSNAGVEQILNAIDIYEAETKTSVKVIVAMIIDRQEPDPIIEGFNENLKKTIGNRIRNGDLLTLVDMYQGAGLTSADYTDNTHPNDTGYNKMAGVWAKALLSPYTPGLHAFPYTLVDTFFIDDESVLVSQESSTVEFTTEIPAAGITF